MSEELRKLIERWRRVSIPVGRDEADPDYANGYEAAMEVAANELEAVLNA